MNSPLVHKAFGTPIDEWIERTPNELPVDAVGLWQVVVGFTRGFDLSGAELEHYVRLSVAKLLERGALPVQGNRNRGWSVRQDLAGPRGESLERIIAYWKSLSHEPNVGDVWFALPQFIDDGSALEEAGDGRNT